MASGGHRADTSTCGIPPWCTRAPLCAADGHFAIAMTDFGPARDDMPRWFTYEEVAESKSVFAYMIGELKYFELPSATQRQ